MCTNVRTFIIGFLIQVSWTLGSAWGKWEYDGVQVSLGTS